jgi:predicted N-formylglutamate amidohydrolase
MAEQTPSIADAGHAAIVVNEGGRSACVLVCEHASRYIPPALDGLGLTGDALTSHIAWDPGAEPVARRLSALLDAPLVLQRYSRLIYDCNRPPEASSAMPEISEVTQIQGNAGLSDADKQQRVRELYEPFHKVVADVLNSRSGGFDEPVFVTIHSFTPVYKGAHRPFELGVLHDQDSRLADALLGEIGSPTDFSARRNEPYGPADGVTHTLNLHCKARGVMNVMLEIRNDVIADEAGQALWADRLAGLISAAAASVRDRIAERVVAVT